MENQTTPPAPSNAGKTMGIVALILGILSLPLSWIPCVGLLAIPPAILSVIFGIIGLVQAKKGNGQAGMAIAGLVIGAVALILSCYMTYFVGSALKEGAEMIQQDSTFMKSLDSAFQQMDTVNMQMDSTQNK